MFWVIFWLFCPPDTLESVSGVGIRSSNFSRVWGGVCEGLFGGYMGFELFFGGIFCVGSNFLVCELWGVLRAGHSS